MKLEKQQKAKEMRRAGASITTIATELEVSKGSVSHWVRSVPLSVRTLQKIKRRSHTAAAVEARRAARINRTEANKNILRSKAADSVKTISKKELQVVGIALYWGEGTKKKRGVVEFTNSDPDMIKVMMQFFTIIAEVPAKKFRGHVYLHSHLEPKQAERYWSKISGIPTSQFHKTSVQHNTKRIQKDTLPFGTFAIVICDTALKLQIEGWTTGVATKIIKK